MRLKIGPGFVPFLIVSAIMGFLFTLWRPIPQAADPAAGVRALEQALQSGKISAQAVMTQPQYAALRSRSDVEAMLRAHAPVGRLRIVADNLAAELRLRGEVIGGAEQPAAGALVRASHRLENRSSADAPARGADEAYGYVRTDAAGRFEVVTARPGSSEAGPASIQLGVWAEGHRDRDVRLILNDDPRLDNHHRAEVHRRGDILARPRIADDGVIEVEFRVLLETAD